VAHVIFRVGSAVTDDPTGEMNAQIIVDGVDITQHCLVDGFQIGNTGDGPHDEWYVQVRFGIESLDVELPNAVLRALRDQAEMKGADQ
jgi:hypothetical protein